MRHMVPESGGETDKRASTSLPGLSVMPSTVCVMIDVLIVEDNDVGRAKTQEST